MSDDLRSKPDSYWKKKLTLDQYHVLREKGTEAPFSGKYINLNSRGVYVCGACGQELFTSDSKFKSDCGWPSFDRIASSDAVELKEDKSLGMDRVEVVCKNCGSHLGHLFDDGPTETGKRYCINSLSLDFNSLPGQT